MDRLRADLREFAADRDWGQFHSPKNLAIALSVEAAELLEPFQWLSESESDSLDAETLEAVRAEIGDVLIYLIQLADRLSIDPLSAARAKLEENKRRYPADRARGSARKAPHSGPGEDV